MHAQDSIRGTLMSLAEVLQREALAALLAVTSSADGAIALIRHRFEASEGAMGRPAQLRLALAVGGGGRLLQRASGRQGLDARWSVGQFNVVLPGQAGSYVSPALEVVGLAVDWAALCQPPFAAAELDPLAMTLHRDATVSALLHALWAAAEGGVLSDALLHAGAMAVLQRLAQLAQQTQRSLKVVRPLSALQVQALLAYIDASRDGRPTVTAMATALGMPTSRLGRALRAATGLSPYTFLTHHRMQWARTELLRGCSVTAVAQSAGYANASKFSAAFRRVVGHAPSICRNLQG